MTCCDGSVAIRRPRRPRPRARARSSSRSGRVPTSTPTTRVALVAPSPASSPAWVPPEPSATKIQSGSSVWRAQLVDRGCVRDDTGHRRAADRDRERRPPLGRERRRELLDRRFDLVVVARAGEVQRRAEQVVEEQVAVVARRLLAREREVAVEPEPVRRGRGHARVVALRAAAGHERVAAPGERLRAEVLELAGLVAAERETGEVVALHEQARRGADRRCEPVQRLEWRGEGREARVVGHERACADARRHHT